MFAQPKFSFAMIQNWNGSERIRDQRNPEVTNARDLRTSPAVVESFGWPLAVPLHLECRLCS